MRPRRNLRILRNQVFRQCCRLEAFQAKLQAAQDERLLDAVVSLTCIQALNVWSEFSRGFLLSSARGAYDCSGRKATATTVVPGGERELACHLTEKLGKKKRAFERRQELRWHKADILQQAAGYLGLTNLEAVDKVLSCNFSFFQDLEPARNFFAHRNPDTAREVRDVARRLAIPGFISGLPRDILLFASSNRPVPLARLWLGEMRQAAAILCG